MTRHVAAAFAIMLSIAGCKPEPRQPAQRTIVAHEVNQDTTNNTWLWGTFSVVPAETGTSMKSFGTGGACLIADFSPHDIPEKGSLGASGQQPYNGTCRTDKQCTDWLLPNERAAEWVGYCVHKTCWTRPGPQKEYCNVDPENPWQPGEHRVPENGYIKSDSHRLMGAKIEWMVIACLNGFNEETKAGDNRACGLGPTGNRVVDYGPTLAMP